MKHFQGKKAADCVTMDTIGSREPMTFNGSVCVPSSDVYLGGMGGSTEATITGGVLILLAGPCGIHQNMTPDTMRSMAEALMKMADLAEQNAARMAAAAIAAAGKPRT